MTHLIDYDIYSLDTDTNTNTDIFHPNLFHTSFCRNDTCVTRHNHNFNAFHNKTYVKYDDKCSICVDCIGPAHKAFITECGHIFHRTCLSEYFHFLKLNKHKLCLICPICRANLGSPEFFGLRYYSDLSTDYKGLDLLENYSNPNNFNDMVHICNSNHIRPHYLGINTNCMKCKLYISGN